MKEDKAVVAKEEVEIVAATPVDIIARASEQANALMDIVEKQELYVTIGDKKYLEVQAWEVIGAFNRVTAVPAYVKPIERAGEIVAYEAKVDLLKDGNIVGSGIMTCGLDEFPCQGKEGQAKHKAAISAAQTWATSKAYRLNYSWVAVLAGYQPTPAEEMLPEAEKEHWCPVHNVPFQKKKKGRQSWYSHLIEGTKEWCNEEKAKKPKELKSPKAEVIEEEPEPPVEPIIEIAKPPSVKMPPAQPKEQVKDYIIMNLGDLFMACYREFNMSSAQVIKELGYSTKEDIPDAVVAWHQIKALKGAQQK